jgi:hypothetical protein
MSGAGPSGAGRGPAPRLEEHAPDLRISGLDLLLHVNHGGFGLLRAQIAGFEAWMTFFDECVAIGSAPAGLAREDRQGAGRREVRA